MRRHRSRTIAAVAVCLCSAAAPLPAHADTRLHIRNPSFNLPAVEQTGTNYVNLGVNGNLAGWSITHGDIDVYGRGFAKNPNGSQAVALNGVNSGTISQTLETTPGVRVTVSWSQSPDTWTGCPAGYSQKYTAGVTADGFTTATFNPGSPNPAGNWTRASFSFVPNQDLTTLEFASVNGGGACGPLITDVTAWAAQ